MRLKLCVYAVRLLGSIRQFAIVCQLTEERHQLTLLRINELNNCKMDKTKDQLAQLKYRYMLDLNLR